ncbi:hypothetical protein BDZ45DRAFT_684103 [Acephala macrosclerotiorum]|nr:hypothetical protein BDZ45DRAFT_684103 [Acephala macrosclerotiorum]
MTLPQGGQAAMNNKGWKNSVIVAGLLGIQGRGWFSTQRVATALLSCRMERVPDLQTRLARLCTCGWDGPERAVLTGSLGCGGNRRRCNYEPVVRTCVRRRTRREPQPAGLRIIPLLGLGQRRIIKLNCHLLALALPLALPRALPTQRTDSTQQRQGWLRNSRPGKFASSHLVLAPASGVLTGGDSILAEPCESSSSSQYSAPLAVLRPTSALPGHTNQAHIPTPALPCQSSPPDRLRVLSHFLIRQTPPSDLPPSLISSHTSSPALLPPQVRVQRLQPSNPSSASSSPSSPSSTLPHDFEGTPTFRRQVQAYTSCLFDSAECSEVFGKRSSRGPPITLNRFVHFTISTESATGSFDCGL